MEKVCVVNFMISVGVLTIILYNQYTNIEVECEARSDCIVVNHNNEVLIQHPVPRGHCKYVKRLWKSVAVLNCLNITYIIGRQTDLDLYGVMLTKNEYKQLCANKTNIVSNDNDECFEFIKLSNITNLYKCPDNTLYLKNTAITFLLQDEFDFICS